MNLDTLAQHTAHPKLYKNTYWGGFAATSCIDEEVVKNRNALADNFCLVKVLARYPITHTNCNGLRVIDHPEWYLTKEGKIVFVFSVYDTEDVRSMAETFCFERIEKIYSASNTSFVKTFECLPQAKKFAKFFNEYFSSHNL